MTTAEDLNPFGGRYVRLVLSLGLHDPDYVDAYYGPAEWRTEVATQHPDLPTITRRTQEFLADLASIDTDALDDLTQLRWKYLERQASALLARTQMLLGSRMSFDDEARRLYDVTPPTFSEEYFRVLVEEVGALLPGSEEVHRRFEEFRLRFTVPPAALAALFERAIAEGRSRTARHLTLPPNERFAFEFVRDKAWSGYNWYQGNSTSLIQINVDLPITIDRAIDLACHEGYPGHHVYNSLLEANLVRRRGWNEFSVYALFSPQSLIAEGTANFGISMAFPGHERVEYEREVLFPLAGLDPSDAEYFYTVHAVVQRLAYAGNEAARQYLEGAFSREQAAAWLERYALMSPDRARQRVDFFDKYRTYVINYNLGQDVVQKHIEAHGGTPDHPGRRWTLFGELLSSPRIPSTL